MWWKVKNTKFMWMSDWVAPTRSFVLNIFVSSLSETMKSNRILAQNQQLFVPNQNSSVFFATTFFLYLSVKIITKLIGHNFRKFKPIFKNYLSNFISPIFENLRPEYSFWLQCSKRNAIESNYLIISSFKFLFQLK